MQLQVEKVATGAAAKTAELILLRRPQNWIIPTIAKPKKRK